MNNQLVVQFEFCAAGVADKSETNQQIKSLLELRYPNGLISVFAGPHNRCAVWMLPEGNNPGELPRRQFFQATQTFDYVIQNIPDIACTDGDHIATIWGKVV